MSLTSPNVSTNCVAGSEVLGGCPHFDGFHDCLHDCIFKVHVESWCGCLRHQNSDDLFFRIHPKVRPVGAAPAETACGERSPTLKRIAHNADTQSITFAAGAAGQRIGDEHGSHHFDCPRAEQPFSVELAAVHQH